MFGPRVARSLALTVSVAAGFACGDYTRATSPPEQLSALSPPTMKVMAAFSLVPSGTKAKALRWGPDHVKVEQSVSALIGPEGGTLSLPGADFSLTIPAEALSAPTSITVVARSGSYVAYDMFPHGLRFLRPAVASQGLGSTAAYGTEASDYVRSAYLSDGNEAIDVDDSASPVELEASTTYYYGARPVAETHAWTVNHFSRYILISGVWVLVTD